MADCFEIYLFVLILFSFFLHFFLQFLSFFCIVSNPLLKFDISSCQNPSLCDNIILLLFEIEQIQIVDGFGQRIDFVLIRSMWHISADCSSGSITFCTVFALIFIRIKHPLSQKIKIGMLQRHNTEVPIAMWTPSYLAINNITSQFNSFDEFAVCEIGAISEKWHSIIIVVVVQNDLLLEIAIEGVFSCWIFLSVQMDCQFIGIWFTLLFSPMADRYKLP